MPVPCAEPRAFNAAPPKRPSNLAFILACVMSQLACSSSGTGETNPPDAGSPDAETGDPGVLAGTFQVRLVAPVPAMNGMPETPGSTVVLGKVYDGPSPSQIVWEAGTKAGDCQLFTPRVPFCTTPCGGSAACVEDVGRDRAHNGAHRE
jgi:hypothetical protein